MKTKASQNAHRGSDFRDFLAGEGTLPEVEVLALKRVVSVQLQQILQHEPVTKTELASRMKTRRASLDRMLDLSYPALTVASLGKASAASSGPNSAFDCVSSWITNSCGPSERTERELAARLSRMRFKVPKMLKCET
jgi:antitoxin HicB